MNTRRLTPGPGTLAWAAGWSAVVSVVGCGSGGPVVAPGRPITVTDAGTVDAGPPALTNVDPPLTERAPVVVSPVDLPVGVVGAVPWVGPNGQGIVVSQDARFLSVDAYGAVTPVERLPDDPTGPGESPPAAVVERAPGEPMVLVPSGALVLQGGWVRKAQFPGLLSNARATTQWGGESLWATSAGVYTTQGGGWFQLQRTGAAVTDATAVVAGPADTTHREAWVLRATGVLMHLSVSAGTGSAGLQVTWSDPVPGQDTSHVRAIAAWGGDQYLARDLDLLRVSPDGGFVRVRIAGEFAGPDLLVSAGPWLWMAWIAADGRGDVARLGAHGAEMVARGLDLHAARMAVDPAQGDTALIVAASGVTRVVMQPALVLEGLGDGATVTSTHLALQASPPDPGAVASVDFRLDGTMVNTAMVAPYGWGTNGALFADLPTLMLGDHTVAVTVHYHGAADLRRSVAFHYASPLGRIPSYATDIAPVFTARCARCHATGVARDLRGYDRLSSQAPLVAAAITERVMPPDLEIDAQTAALFTTWVAGGTPP